MARFRRRKRDTRETRGTTPTILNQDPAKGEVFVKPPNIEAPIVENLDVRGFSSDQRIPDLEWFQQAYASGYRVYVMDCQSREGYPKTFTAFENTESQLTLARTAGLRIALTTKDPRWWSEAITAAGSEAAHLQFFALNATLNVNRRITAAMVDGITALGVRPMIFTGWGMYPQIMGKTHTQFFSTFLWDTQSITFRPYNGWTSRVANQGQMDYNLNGVLVDLSDFDSTKFLDL